MVYGKYVTSRAPWNIVTSDGVEYSNFEGTDTASRPTSKLRSH